MKFNRQLIIFAVVVCLLIPIISLAKECSNDPALPNDTQLCNPIERVGGNNLQTFAILVLQVFAGAAGIVTIIFVMFSGFRFLISQGNSEDVEIAKRSLQWSLSGLVLMLFSYVLVSAIGSFFGLQPIDPKAGPVLTNPIAVNTFNDLYLKFINGFFGIIGVLAVFMIILNGFRYITARGNDEQVQTAKSGLLYAVIGVVIVLMAYVLVRATATFFGAN